MRLLLRGVGMAAMAILAASAQDALPDWVLLLSRAKHHLKDNFERIPNYECQETVNRLVRKAADGPLIKVDSLHFEVAVVGKKELRAVPSGGGFTDKQLTSYISEGVLVSGMFASLPSDLFVLDAGRVTGHRDGAPLLNVQPSFDYEMSDTLEVATAQAHAVVSERGTYWVDSETLDLIKIEDHAIDVPLPLGMKSIDMTMEYARMQIGKSSVLLPQSAVLAVTHWDGSQMRNETAFSGCHEYTSESTVHFVNP